MIELLSSSALDWETVNVIFVQEHSNRKDGQDILNILQHGYGCNRYISMEPQFRVIYGATVPRTEKL